MVYDPAYLDGIINLNISMLFEFVTVTFNI